MSDRWRLVLKLMWMATLVTALVLLSQVRYDFVYQGF
jgi:hypothetical protein